MKDIFLLDMDETLLDFRRAERANFFHTLSSFSLCADEECYAHFHRINDALWKLLERGGIGREELKVRRFGLLCEECGFEADVPALAQTYWENFPEFCFPFAGAAEFLRTLAARGRAYIVTNGGVRIQRAHIALAGFTPYLSDVFISEEVGADKPSKAFSDYVKSHIPAFSESRAVWLGDSLTSDMACAEAAGIDFILYAARGVPQGYTGKCAQDYGEALRLIGEM